MPYICSKDIFSLQKKEREMITAKLTSKGQITIPRKVREKLGISPGEEILFSESGDTFTIRKVMKESPFDKWVGYLNIKKGTTSDKIVNDLRGK